MRALHIWGWSGRYNHSEAPAQTLFLCSAHSSVQMSQLDDKQETVVTSSTRSACIEKQGDVSVGKALTMQV